MQRILALAAGDAGALAISGGARAKGAGAAGGGGEDRASAAKVPRRRVGQKEMREAVLKHFRVATPADLLRDKLYQMSTVGDRQRTFRGGNAANEWRDLYRRFIAVPMDERNLPDGGSVINGIDIMKNFRPWAVFGLDPKKASMADVDKSFRRLALKHHPDVGGDRTVFERLLAMKNSVKALMDSSIQDRIDALRARCEWTK